jgi:hypothetical protein
VLIYVWAFEQEKKKYDQQDVLVPWHLQEKYDKASVPAPTSAQSSEAKEEEDKDKDKDKEIAIEKRASEKVFNRYYHMFKAGELEQLVSETHLFTIGTSYYDHENWCLQCIKI